MCPLVSGQICWSRTVIKFLLAIFGKTFFHIIDKKYEVHIASTGKCDTKSCACNNNNRVNIQTGVYLCTSKQLNYDE